MEGAGGPAGQLPPPDLMRSLVMSDPKGRALLERLDKADARKRQQAEREQQMTEAAARRRELGARQAAARTRPEKQRRVIIGLLIVLASAGCLWASIDGQMHTDYGTTAPAAPPATVMQRESATEIDPVTGETIPAAGTQARDDMERKETACFDSGRTDCADHPGAVLRHPSSYP
jgi:hypothetical protein